MESAKKGIEPLRLSGSFFSVGKAGALPYGGLERHVHEEIELFYVTSGWVNLTVEDVEYSLIEGEAVVIPPGLIHGAERSVARPCSFATVRFEPSLFSDYGYRRLMRPLMLDGKSYTVKLSGDGGWQKETLRILEELLLFAYSSDGIEVWQLEFYGLIFILWNKLYNNQYAGSPAVQAYQKLYKRLVNSIEYIHSHYTEEVTDGILAKQVNLAVGTFCRYFKQLLGVTPIHYLNKIRILKSRELLSNTDRRVSDIAFMCGYNNLSHFNREFKRFMRCTPSEYRKNEIGNDPIS